MPTGYQIKDQEAVYYITLQIVDWVDVFTRTRYRDIVIDSMKYCQQHKSFEIFAYVKRILGSIEEEPESRRDWMLKCFSDAASKHSRNDKYQLWTHENHAIILYSPAFFKEKLDYIHSNPVRAGIVEKPEEYIYSSAKNYAGEKGLIDVSVISYAMLGMDKAY